MAEGGNYNLFGLVDMGSNGIRFSITDIASPTSRILPTKYMYRNGISLYEVQFDDNGNRRPIPHETIELVVGAFLGFQKFCADFNVPFSNIRVVATEATRKASNMATFIATIYERTRFKVELLSPAEEGVTGAWGIASSASRIRGLVMDLGGGSTQITWVITKDGHMRTSQKGALSFPYGAASMTRKLADIDNRSTSPEEREEMRELLRQEMRKNFLDAYMSLDVPDELVKEAEKNNGFPLYLSGGGFRGWGYILLYEAQTDNKNYPISIINGFRAQKKDFEDTKAVEKVAKEAEEIFRVSDRRRSQVPAVAFLVNVLATAIPHGIHHAHFCQGGVREGLLFSKLPAGVRKQSPIEVATSVFAQPLAYKLSRLLHHAFPKHDYVSTDCADETIDELTDWSEVPSPKLLQKVPASYTPSLMKAFANMMYVHADVSKEQAAMAGLYSTTTGALASVHGTSHKMRAMLGLLLEARYVGDLPPREFNFKEALRSLCHPTEVWWANYIGAVGLVLSRVYPAGHGGSVEACFCEDEVCSCEPDTEENQTPEGYQALLGRDRKPHLRLSAKFSDKLGKTKDQSGIQLTFTLRVRAKEGEDPDPMDVEETIKNASKKITVCGKKRNWIRPGRPLRGGHPYTIDEDDQPRLNDSGDDEEGTESGEDIPGWGMMIKVKVKKENMPGRNKRGRGRSGWKGKHGKLNDKVE